MADIQSIIDTDFLVIGSGVAGLRAAIQMSSAGDVLVITKDTLTESSSEYAQGGIAVALSDEDEVGIHFEDTIRAGDGLCRQEAVKVLVEEGPERIMELIRWGAEFDRRGSKLDFTMEAAHSRRRVLHAHGDSTGQEIIRVLLGKVKSIKNIKRLPYCMAVDLTVDEGRCTGAIVLTSSGLSLIRARATVLATGGCGQVFLRTTNPSVATADGVALALRSGAVIEDMEFIQFHPTVLYLPEAPQFLLTEAMRGEGAKLRNINGETFMQNYHPDAELAPRDIVSRAIISELVRTKSSHVFLDLTHLDSAFVRKRFPRIYKTCLQYGIDITKDLIPVTPAAHYTMGGVKTDLYGRTSIRALYAAGEVACTGVHGANRLASNSLLEGLVFGARAGETARHEVCIYSRHSTRVNLTFARQIEGLQSLKRSLRKTMWERAGIIRCEESLNRALEFLKKHDHILQGQYLSREEIEFKNLLSVARIITEAALRRKCSIGSHYRSDYPEKQQCYYHQCVVSREGDLLFYRDEQ